MIKSKAYNYYTMMKMAYLWLPVISVVAVISSSFEKLRFFLYMTVVAATYGGVLNQMRKKSIQSVFSRNSITIDKEIILLSDIENYYTCLPLNELFMLRLTTKNGKKVLYIGKEFREEIETFLQNTQIPIKKTANDTFLKYSPLSLAFAVLFVGLGAYLIYEEVRMQIKLQQIK